MSKEIFKFVLRQVRNEDLPSCTQIDRERTPCRHDDVEEFRCLDLVDVHDFILKKNSQLNGLVGLLGQFKHVGVCHLFQVKLVQHTGSQGDELHPQDKGAFARAVHIPPSLQGLKDSEYGCFGDIEVFRQFPHPDGGVLREEVLENVKGPINGRSLGLLQSFHTCDPELTSLPNWV